MKQRRWLMIGGAAALTLMSLQVAAGHDSRGMWGGNGYGGSQARMPGGMSGHSGPGYGGGYSHQDNNGYGRHGAQHGSQYSSQYDSGTGHDRYERLGLDDKQRTAIRKIMRDARSEFRKLQSKLTDIRHALYDLLEDDKAGKEADKLADSMGALMAERIKLRTGLRVKINKLLTKDQREQSRDMMFFGRGFGR